MYVKKSVPRDTSRVNPGAVTAKHQEITLIDTADILEMPARDAKGVLISENIVLKEGANMIKLYLTPSMQEPSYASDGDEDAESFTHKVSGFHPGNSLDAKEFIQNWLGRPAIALWSGCSGERTFEMYGSPCAPLKLKAEFMANNEKTGFTVNFESVQKTSYVPATYSGVLTFESYFAAADFNIAAVASNGSVQQLPATAAAEAIDFATTDLEHGDTLSLVGGGGSSPATLSTGAATAANVILKDGVVWTALNEAVLHLKVVYDGTDTYFIETSRA